jgi:3-hydroxyacyl-CoA dehydrogenase/enoyl-CoA hydratase/3-hydroxybutyryl-CoA epimerase
MTTPVTVSHFVDADAIGWIVFDDPASRANVFNPATQADLRAAIAALAAAPVRAVVIASGKEKIFIAGADLKWLGQITRAADGEAASRDGQALFASLDTFQVPVVCAIHGACAGGGFELALACHWRLASDAKETVIGLPEVGIGLIPGWGGCARLPRLIGTPAAVDHILKAQLLPAAEAHRAGLVDEIVPPAEWPPRDDRSVQSVRRRTRRSSPTSAKRPCRGCADNPHRSRCWRSWSKRRTCRSRTHLRRRHERLAKSHPVRWRTISCTSSFSRTR